MCELAVHHQNLRPISGIAHWPRYQSDSDTQSTVQRLNLPSGDHFCQQKSLTQHVSQEIFYVFVQNQFATGQIGLMLGRSESAARNPSAYYVDYFTII